LTLPGKGGDIHRMAYEEHNGLFNKSQAKLPACAGAFLFLVMFLSCAYRYEEVRIRRYYVPDKGVVAANIGTKESAKHAQRQKVSRRCYFAVMRSSKPFAVLNDRGVQYALEGRFPEAEILFKEALKECPECAPAMNNLGIVYDVFGRRKEAFDWYSRACLMEPNNDVFRENFLSASETGIK
jgi:tetratricopeptide (TPR) repeat protein